MPVLQRFTGERDGDLLRGRHLLLLPDSTAPEDVEALVRTRYPEVVVTREGLRIGRHTVLTGPVMIDRRAAEAARVPAGWSLVYVLDCPTERGDPPWQGTTDPDGLYRAFPAGLPVRAEGRAVSLLVSLARRLGGALRVHTAAVVLTPDPEVAVDVVVHSPYWVEPEDLHGVIAARRPDARLAVEAEPWIGPPAGLVDAPPDEASTGLTAEQRAELHEYADQQDGKALEGDVVLDAYAVVLDVTPGWPGDGMVEVRVHIPEEAPPEIAGLDWATSSVTYEVRWLPVDEVEALLEAPGGALVAARRRATVVVNQVAKVIAEITDGVPVDADGFLVDPDYL